MGTRPQRQIGGVQALPCTPSHCQRNTPLPLPFPLLTPSPFLPSPALPFPAAAHRSARPPPSRHAGASPHRHPRLQLPRQQRAVVRQPRAGLQRTAEGAGAQAGAGVGAGENQEAAAL